MNRSEHVTLNSATGCFECRHCGASYKPNLPCSLTMYLGMNRMFIREHRTCQQPARFAPDADLPLLLWKQAD